jgi:hypothetical protein
MLKWIVELQRFFVWVFFIDDVSGDLVQLSGHLHRYDGTAGAAETH